MGTSLVQKVKLKVKSLPGAFSALRPRGPIVFLPQQVPAFISRMRETSTSEDGNYPPILPVGLNLQESRCDFFTCRKAGTWDILFYFPSEGKHTEDFSDAGFEPANSGSSGQHANH
jgi:hypothetical protein